MRASSALVLAGAFTQGAYDAGVLTCLAERGIEISCAVAASSGALNALMYASGVRRRQPLAAAQRLAELWEKEASVMNLLRTSVSLPGIVRARGMFDQTLLYSLMREHVPPCTMEDAAPVTLRVVTSPLTGIQTRIRGNDHRTYEHVETFTDSDFDSSESLERIFQYVAASTALPFFFTPVDLPELGPTVDGGAVNDTPVAAACGGAQRIYLVSAFPRQPPTDPRSGGLELAELLGNVLIHERLVRDLRRLPPGVEVLPIRPPAPLPGGGLKSLFSSSLRAQFIEIGYNCARRALDGQVG